MGNEKKKKYVTFYKSLTVKTIDGSTLAGKINIAQNSRISDMFLSPEPFIVMTDVVSRNCENKTRIVNKAHITWVEPDDIEE